ncbi:SIS domain-containing protein [Terriglobus sp.]|uniref:SIS domain-containing protein n=1 Tax=Terriglobus sp. TaxID=1889013 RepID=UPI003B005E38
MNSPSTKPQSATARQWPHHMLQEIYEQPESLARTVALYSSNGRLQPEFLERVRPLLTAPDMIVVASGSSRHAGLAGEIAVEDLAGLPVDVEYASEYALRPATARKQAAVLAISQSGETADTLAALRAARERGHRTAAITNVEGSSMAREAEVSLPTPAGREIAIPATKSFTAQLAVLHALALAAAQVRGVMTETEVEQRLARLEQLPAGIAAQLPEWERSVEAIAPFYSRAKTLLFLGRGIHYPMAREGSLKLKESSYLHAEGYPTGELRHGPNALVSPEVPLVVLATRDPADADSLRRYESTLQLLEGMKKQGATVLALANRDDRLVPGLSTHILFVDEQPEHLLPIAEVIPLQLLAYFVAVRNGVDVDRPRNLSKAVLVE